MVGVRRRMELIGSDKKRELTFQGRVKSMKKKAYELSTLCGIDIGMIVCSPSGQIETLSWPNQDDGGKTLEDLIRSSRNQDGMRKKTVNVTRISKGETQNQAGESQLDVKSKQFVSCSSQLGEQSGPSLSCHPQLDMKSEKELRERAMCLDNKIERVKERIQYLKKEKQVAHQVADDTSLLEDYEIMNPGDLDYLLNKIMDQPLTPIHEDFVTPWPHELPSLVQPTAATFASNNYTNCHSNIPSVMATGGYPMSSTSRQVMIGRAAFQDFIYNSNLQEPQYTNDNIYPQLCTSSDQLSYNPYLWSTPY
ncbi:MADS-box transcription factor PHERES 1 [Artemisia annua]|uniref:MADS-box transcription factor PHERES 1 n=1 Tax=Artemisia annua TaxID=35608 RepID=A0A2U1LSH4_ARTAN|nr:MADS-box transcription factor PHERES 1 [Artemisia annua]